MAVHYRAKTSMTQKGRCYVSSTAPRLDPYGPDLSADTQSEASSSAVPDNSASCRSQELRPELSATDTMSTPCSRKREKLSEYWGVIAQTPKKRKRSNTLSQIETCQNEQKSSFF